MDPQIEANIKTWLEGEYDLKTKEAIKRLEAHDPEELENAFYTHLSFGTGGLRGLMGVGTNRMNEYTVRAATQGLANYLKKQKLDHPSVLIGYDSRHHSCEFAKETAKVLAGNGIGVYLFKEMRPVPLVSFGCRFKKASAAIMITASHNPPTYNGYKVYWNYGGQVLPPHDKRIIQEVNAIRDLKQVNIGKLDDPLVQMIGDEVDEAYLEAIEGLQVYPNESKLSGDDLHIIYTPLHGTGITMVPKALAMWDFLQVILVEPQAIPDGAFPTVASPNPEEHAALKMGIDKLVETGADILLATDPDADRVGVVTLHQEEVTILNGNEIAVILLDHILGGLSASGRLPKKAAVIKSIVTTELFRVIAEANHVECYDVLTGFKYIGEMMTKWEDEPNSPIFLFGAEESYGYLAGTYARDKDAVISCALLAEAALHAKLQGKTLVDLLHDIYTQYGVYRERLLSLKFEETKAGRDQMTKAMQNLRSHPPEKLLGTHVLFIEDYLSSEKVYLKTKKKEKISLPPSDVVALTLEDGTRLVVRPSGTEPKVKLYCGVKSRPNSPIDLGIEHCDTLSNEYLKALKTRLL